MRSWCAVHGIIDGARCVWCSPPAGLVPFRSASSGAVVYQPTVVLRPDLVDIGYGSRVDSFCKIEGDVVVGKYVHVASFCHVRIGGGHVLLGDYSAVASGARILSGSNIVDGQFSGSAVAPPEMQAAKRAVTTIGPRAFLGAGCTVMPGVTVGEGAVVGACSLVTRDVPPMAIVTGVPARYIRNRVRHDH